MDETLVCLASSTLTTVYKGCLCLDSSAMFLCSYVIGPAKGESPEEVNKRKGLIWPGGGEPHWPWASSALLHAHPDECSRPTMSGPSDLLQPVLQHHCSQVSPFHIVHPHISPCPAIKTATEACNSATQGCCQVFFRRNKQLENTNPK